MNDRQKVIDYYNNAQDIPENKREEIDRFEESLAGLTVCIWHLEKDGVRHWHKIGFYEWVWNKKYGVLLTFNLYKDSMFLILIDKPPAEIIKYLSKQIDKKHG